MLLPDELPELLVPVFPVLAAGSFLIKLPPDPEPDVPVFLLSSGILESRFLILSIAELSSLFSFLITFAGVVIVNHHGYS